MESSSNLLERKKSVSDLSAEVEETSTATTGLDSSGHSSAGAGTTATTTATQHGSDETEEDIFEQVQMILRKRRGWGPDDSLSNDLHLLEYDDELGEEDDAGCPLPSTPEDTQLIEAEVWEASWKVCHYKNLPKWLQDNDFLHRGHRPPLPSFRACFKSIFRIHTETGNIWTHLLGFIAFLGVAVYFITRPSVEIQTQEKIVFGAFFIGAIVCLGFSFTFHTLSCHSVEMGRLFSKLDYCGIALLIMGSFVPWLYYGFYCHYQPKVIYLSVVCVLGVLSIIVSLWDKFSEPALRPLRAGVFMSFGLSGVIPAIHYSIMEGWFSQMSRASLGWLILMGLLYIIGALLYALRVPERWFPGKFDIWGQSHQIFHILVIAAAFVHYHGISEMAMYRVMYSECTVPIEPITF
ncbi:adiponectin receptor protein isoform X2 [Drosophila pseudoobscura]|uniref:Adiponectin receptor protein isoform X2 n=1 Tax=Drosophila pseudoobscura pseudoobscura TaxID=46245 RepID=A0A6I8UMN5_DROPS|nr:adiponectin receptor protein isoform X2 [Drosophila pseudoobscura]